MIEALPPGSVANGTPRDRQPPPTNRNPVRTGGVVDMRGCTDWSVGRRATPPPC